METVNLQKMELEAIKSQPIEQRIESLYDLIKNSDSSTFDEDMQDFLVKNLSLELKAIKLANRTKCDSVTLKAVDFYNELINDFGSVENFNKFRKQMSYFN
jgi:hypothetical protein